MAKKKSVKVRAKPGDVFEFLVKLHWDSLVTRRIALQGQQTLVDFHEAIFEAFDRYDEHLYAFLFLPPGRTGRAAMRDAVRYELLEFSDAGDPHVRDVDEAVLAELNLAKGQKFLYEFDFGDEWWHDVKVVSIDGPDDGGEYPRLVEAVGKSPPQYPDDDDDDEYDDVGDETDDS